MNGRIEALEQAIGQGDDDLEARALREMPDEELDQHIREILAKKDPPAADDMSEYAVTERKVRSFMAKRDAERASK